MRVNRIYFRGLKTFRGAFAILTVIASCGLARADEGIAARIRWVSRTPAIIDLTLPEPCQDTVLLIRTPGNTMRVPLWRAPTAEGKNPDATARLLLGQGSESGLEGPIFRVQCAQHGLRDVHPDGAPGSDSGFSTPDWAKGAVWYQVFPERFLDGNPNNNPRGWDVTPLEWGAPFGIASSEEIEQAWSRRLVDPPRFGLPVDRPMVTNVVYARRYGGDLMGVYDRLESLKAQGFTGVYLCPIFQSRSLHKYDADDHRHIDPTLGSPGVYDDPGPGHTRLAPGEDPSDESTWAWTPADRWFIDVFLPKAKSLGLRVVLDGVWNHVGLDHFAFRDVRERGADSSFADWFQTAFDEHGKLIAWQGWDGVNGNLPEFVQIGDDLAPGPKAHIMAVTRRWMDPNGDGDPSDGIDGWRLDVAGEIGKGFWRDWRAQVKSLNPEALIVAEIWSDAGDMLGDNAFDAQMNYPFAFPVADWLSIGDPRGDARLAAARLERVFHHAPQVDLTQFNLMTSHDTERLASMMHNDVPRGYDQGARRWGRDTKYDPEMINEDDMSRCLCAIAAMVAAPGAMMIYNGDEHALPGGDDPDNRRPIPWEGLETGDRPEFHACVRALVRLRADPIYSELLRFGDARFGAVGNNVLRVRRQLSDRMVEVFIAPGGIRSLAVPSAPQGWRLMHESKRNFGLAGKGSLVLVRLMEPTPD